MVRTYRSTQMRTTSFKIIFFFLKKIKKEENNIVIKIGHEAQKTPINIVKITGRLYHIYKHVGFQC